MLFTPLRLSEPVRLFLPTRPRQLAWSPSGSRLSCVLYGQAPVVVESDGTLQDMLMARSELATGLCWSPDSRVVAVALPGELRFWDVAARMPLPLVLTFNVRAIDALDWSMDDRLVLWLADQILCYTLSPASLQSAAALTPQRIATN